MNNKKIEAFKLANALADADEAVKKLTDVYFEVGMTINEMNQMARLKDALDVLSIIHAKRFENELN